MQAVVVVLLLLSGCFVALEAGECNSYEREKLNEGYYKCVYKDPLGIPTIGVGFNLKKFGARAEIESVGANYDAVLNGSKCLDDSQIESLFNKDMDSAVDCAERFASGLPSSPASAIADMAFNMGCATLNTFTSLRGEAPMVSGCISHIAQTCHAIYICNFLHSKSETSI